MATARCYVTPRDYRLYFDPGTGPAAPPPPVPRWDGTERRTGAADRRSGKDRRWDATKGRRRFSFSFDRRAKRV